MSLTRPIDQRYYPPVAGIDLAQALNYLALPEVGVDFIYERYTGARLPYRQGARPELERVARGLGVTGSGELAIVEAVAEYVATQVPWAGYYEKLSGIKLRPDRQLSEEALIATGYGWCNEQARVFCALTQILGVPSRLVFAARLECRYGHVVVEALLPDGWMMVDESFGYCFRMAGKPVRAADVFHVTECREYFEPRYRELCQKLAEELGSEILQRDFGMAVAANPLDGFTDLGYHNHFVV